MTGKATKQVSFADEKIFYTNNRVWSPRKKNWKLQQVVCLQWRIPRNIEWDGSKRRRRREVWGVGRLPTGGQGLGREHSPLHKIFRVFC